MDDAGNWADTNPNAIRLLNELAPSQQTIISFTSLFCTRFESLIEFHSGVRDQPPQLPEQPVIPVQPTPQLPKPTLQLSKQPMPVIPQSAPSVPEQPTPELPKPTLQLSKQPMPVLPEQPVVPEKPVIPEQPTVPQLSELPQQPTPQVPEQPVLPEQPTLQLPEQPVIPQSAPLVLRQPITSVLPQQLPQPDFTFTLTHLTQQSDTTLHYWFWPIMGVG
ncbi:hypothetical protein HO173_012867 [Letharia columbiana]|uniref:Uncharacterized protein n=1 Tax=Letharia columbiana TaxID=112416 RepID=A0A8H6CJW2_9LECA|nr:uncharacterized protein HO173_012867 [Letharia columbiana]KAF6224710.1 hypothetical protein HO173_012867 [Letharia columbiana]